MRKLFMKLKNKDSKEWIKDWKKKFLHISSFPKQAKTKKLVVDNSLASEMLV